MIILPRLLHAQWIPLIVNHLWQSTIFALAAWLLTLVLKKNQARIRYWLWMMASMKFLLPFSLLIKAGERFHSHSSMAAMPGLSAAMNGFTEPFSGSVAAQPVTPTAVSAAAQSVAQTHSDILPMVLLAIWACGALFLLARWGVRWLRIRRIVWAASPIAMECAVPVRSAPGHLEPGIFGIFRPVLLLPEGITERLSPAQLDAIVAHEICHVRRRDNLTAALHMLVEVVFWFYPLVWWIGAGLMKERERACDEAVVESHSEVLTYAEGILNVCKSYMETPINCVSGVMGSDLKERISRILSGIVAGKLSLRRKLLLALAAVLAVAVPVTTGVIHNAQAAAETGIEGTWQGTLEVQQEDRRMDIRVVLKIAKTDADGINATLYFIDQDSVPMSSSSASFEGGVLKFTTERFDISYEGNMSTDNKTITGVLPTPEGSLPLVLERATPATEWPLPEYVVYEVDQVEDPPTVMRAFPPAYPPEAEKNNISGSVTVELIVTKWGTSRDERVVESEPPGVFDEAALEAIRQYQFSPGQRKFGDPELIEVRIKVPIKFTPGMPGPDEAENVPEVFAVNRWSMDPTEEIPATRVFCVKWAMKSSELTVYKERKEASIPSPPPHLFVRYPDAATRDKIEGHVVVSFVVDADGKAKDPEVLEADPEGVFEESAMEDIKQYRFTPTILDGEQVPSALTITVEYTLERQVNNDEVVDDLNRIKASLDALYGPLYKKLDLSPESLDEFKEIIADQRMARINMQSSINGASSEEEKTDIQQEYDTIRDEYNDKYLKLLGHEKYELLKAYDDSTTERNYLNGFLNTVSPEIRINEDQVEEFVSSMHKVVEEVSAERGYDDKEIVFPSDVDEEKIAYLIGVMTRINEGFIDVSKDFLEPSQVEQFEDFLNQDRDRTEEQLEFQALEYGG